MAIVIEDGTGQNPAANAYIDLPAADAHHRVRPTAEAWAELPPSTREAALVDATRAIEAIYTWRGAMILADQPLGWPRYGVVDDEGRIIANDSVPPGLAAATAQLALRIVERGGLFASASASNVTSERLGDWAATYSGGGKRIVYPEIDVLLRGLVSAGGMGGGMQQRRIVRWS